MPFYPQVPSSGGVTFPVTVAQGGTGETTAAAGLAALGGTTLAAVPGRWLCAPNIYAPGSQTPLTVTGTTFAAFSSGVVCTNVFTAPASGSVLVTVSAVIEEGVSGTAMNVALAAVGTVTPVLGDVVAWQDSSTGGGRQAMWQAEVTGLTSGDSYQFDVLGANGTAADTTVILAQAYNSTTATTNKGGPVIVTVQAV
jgi:hypothetical protein